MCVYILCFFQHPSTQTQHPPSPALQNPTLTSQHCTTHGKRGFSIDPTTQIETQSSPKHLTGLQWHFIFWSCLTSTSPPWDTDGQLEPPLFALKIKKWKCKLPSRVWKTAANAKPVVRSHSEILTALHQHLQERHRHGNESWKLHQRINSSSSFSWGKNCPANYTFPIGMWRNYTLLQPSSTCSASAPSVFLACGKSHSALLPSSQNGHLRSANLSSSRRKPIAKHSSSSQGSTSPWHAQAKAAKLLQNKTNKWIIGFASLRATVKSFTPRDTTRRHQFPSTQPRTTTIPKPRRTKSTIYIYIYILLFPWVPVTQL